MTTAPAWAIPYLPAGAPINPYTLYLAAWAWIVANHYGYNNANGDARCTGADHTVDCSGGVTLALTMAFEACGLPAPVGCLDSFEFAALCRDEPRPQWMTNLYGTGTGTEVAMNVAQNRPAAWGFHNPWDTEGTDGHIKTAYYGYNVSVEAMDFRLGVNYSTFSTPVGFIDYCALPPMLLPWLAPDQPPTPPPTAPEVDVITVQDPTRPALNGGLDQPHAEFVAANPLFAGGAILRNGSRVVNDKPYGNTGDHIIEPTLRAPGHVWVSMCAKPGVTVVNNKLMSHGLTFTDDHGLTSGVNVGYWADDNNQPSNPPAGTP